MTCVSENLCFFYVSDSILQIRNCLDEYVVNGIRVKMEFEGSEYSSIYDAILELIDDIKTNPYHNNKWQENRRLWARRGWFVFLNFLSPVFLSNRVLYGQQADSESSKSTSQACFSKQA